MTRRTVPCGRGEKDCRIWDREGNEAFFKRSSRSGDESIAICGLSDDAIRDGEATRHETCELLTFIIE
jgi:hypothetical protein